VPRAARVALATAGGVVLLLVVAQLALPSLAERRLRDRLERSGTVERVEISAFPAVKLLWHRADDVTVRMGRLRTGSGRFADLLSSTRDADDVDASAAEQRILTLRMLDPRLRKRGDKLTLSARVTYADLRAALPPGFDVRPVASVGGQLLVAGTADLLGQSFSGSAVISVRDGRLQLTPDIPFGGFLSVTLFADPRIEVQAIGFHGTADGFTVSARARLRSS
jgi:hypothetical protein